MWSRYLISRTFEAVPPHRHQRWVEKRSRTARRCGGLNGLTTTSSMPDSKAFVRVCDSASAVSPTRGMWPHELDGCFQSRAASNPSRPGM